MGPIWDRYGTGIGFGLSYAWDQLCMGISSAFAELPSTKQHTLAMGFRHFTEEFKKRLQNLQQERGADYVVTKEDIMDFNEDIRSRRQ